MFEWPKTCCNLRMSTPCRTLFMAKELQKQMGSAGFGPATSAV
jgi:hypothetical protein